LIELYHERDHPFKKGGGHKTCHHTLADGRECRRARYHPLHHGPLPSLNVAGSGANHWTYQNTKKLWQARFTELLEATDLPKFNESLLVEGLVCFPDKRKRDMGNFRYLAEKCLGDALVEGDWLVDDSWYPVLQYEFGRLEARYEKDVAWIRLMVMPSNDY
jgi:hypothetical protein